jgi:hypothetical protein
MGGLLSGNTDQIGAFLASALVFTLGGWVGRKNGGFG